MIVANFEELTKAGNPSTPPPTRLTSSRAHRRRTHRSQSCACASSRHGSPRLSGRGTWNASRRWCAPPRHPNAVPAAQLAKWRSDISRLNDKAKQDLQAERQARTRLPPTRRPGARARSRARGAVRPRARARKSSKRNGQSRPQRRRQRPATADASASQAPEPARRAETQALDPAGVSERGPRQGHLRLVTVGFTVDVEGKTQTCASSRRSPPGCSTRRP